MYEKYLIKLLELLTELENDSPNLERDERFLAMLLDAVLVAYYFRQVPELANYIGLWKLDINSLVIDLVRETVEARIEVEGAEISPIEAGAKSYEDRVNERINRLLQK